MLKHWIIKLLLKYEPEFRKAVLEASSRLSLRAIARQSLGDEIASSLSSSQRLHESLAKFGMNENDLDKRERKGGDIFDMNDN